MAKSLEDVENISKDIIGMMLKTPQTPPEGKKVNQVLISISPRDFSFIVEENMGSIFSAFSKHRVKINTMQNSAISFSLCVDNDPQRLPALIEELGKQYRVLYNDNMELVTVRYYDQPTLDRVTVGKTILLEVKSRYTAQLVLKDS